MYENTNDNFFDNLLMKNSFSKIINEIEYKSNVVKYDRDKLNEIKNDIKEIEKKQTELNKEKETLENLKIENETKKAELEKLIEEKKIEIEKEKAANEMYSNNEQLNNIIVEANNAINFNTSITYTTANNYGYSDQQIDLICAIVAQECSTNYDGALAVITCAMNRCNSSEWKRFGADPLSQLCAKGQFCYSIDGYHKKRLNGNYEDFVKQAVLDCLNGKRNHNYLSFRGYKKAGSVNIGDNWYFSPM